MHVFIDTNILLNFFRYSKDQLDALNKVFASHEHGTTTVYLTRQIYDEFKRNRENKIKDAITRFEEVKFSAQLPSFMKIYQEYDSIHKLSKDLESLRKSILEKARVDIVKKNLLADQLIEDIFARETFFETTPDIFATANMRNVLGNPPGKKGSIGDAINWTILLQNVPNKESLHIISDDGDFYSILTEGAVHPYLEEEWSNTKNASLYVYKSLNAFMKQHFDGVAFPFDLTKDALIDDLSSSRNFENTHNIVAQLEEFTYFSLEELERILAAAVKNKQFGLITTDRDVSDFLNRFAVPRLADIILPEQKEILQQVIKEKSERKSKS